LLTDDDEESVPAAGGAAGAAAKRPRAAAMRCTVLRPARLRQPLPELCHATPASVPAAARLAFLEAAPIRCASNCAAGAICKEGDARACGGWMGESC